MTPIATLTLEEAPADAQVGVLGYQPEYHPGRRQWFVDVAMDPGASLWPFVRLAVARYQPDSLAPAGNCHPRSSPTGSSRCRSGRRR